MGTEIRLTRPWNKKFESQKKCNIHNTAYIDIDMS